MTGWIWAVGRMLGLSTSAGLRAALTLAVIGVLAREGWGINLSHSFAWMENGIAIAAFIVVAIVESSFDKIPALDRLQNRLALPWRIAAGALAGGAALSHGWVGLVIGVVAGGGLAYLGQAVKRAARPRTTINGLAVGLLSLIEDVTAFAAAVLSAVLAPLGYVFFAWTLWLFDRLRRRERAKYKGLRVLR